MIVHARFGAWREAGPRQGKAHRELTALIAAIAPDLHGAAVQLDELLDERQADAEAFGRRDLRVFAAGDQLEPARQQFR